MVRYPLGRHVDHDPRSRGFSFVPDLAPKTLQAKSVQWSMTSTVLNQKKSSSCTGNAIAALLNTDLFTPVRKKVHRGTLLTETDAVRLYSKATALDNLPGVYPPNDDGSSGLGAAKAAKFYGYIDRYTHCFSFDHFRAALQTQPVIVGTVWTNDMFTPRNGILSVGPLTDANIAGGHEYLVRGIDYGTELLTIRNSWGKGWGAGGEAFIRFTDFVALLGVQGDVTVPHGVGLP